MGNIEIRQQSSPKRRTQIFTDHKSYDAARSDCRKSLTQRYEKSSNYSPIKFSKTSLMQRQIPLTQRKVNTARQQTQKQQRYSPVLNQQNIDYKKSFTLFSKFSKITKNRTMQVENQPQEYSSPVNLTGRIVSNSRRVNQQRKVAQSINTIISNARPVQNPLETRQIIKKVRNFNDFLNQIKRKLKEDKQQTLTRNKSRLHNLKKQPLTKKQNSKTSNFQHPACEDHIIEEVTSNLFQKTKSVRRIQVALKLENQKLELQKYRKLVQRELSKTHSIENISLCTRNSGQKILTIQYESILPHNVFSYNNSKATLQKESSQNSLVFKTYEGNLINQNKKFIQKNQQKKQIDNQQSIMLKKLKNQYQNMMKNMIELGKTIQKYQNNTFNINKNQNSRDKILIKDESDLDRFIKTSSVENPSKIQTLKSYELQKDKNNKIQKIQGLFEKLNDIQIQYQQTDRQIRQAICNSFSDSQLQQTLN